MVRKIVLLTMVSAVAFATVPVAAAWTGVPSSSLYQSDDELSEEPTLDLGDEGEASSDVVEQIVVEELDLGERFVSDSFALEVQGYLTAQSVDNQQLRAIRVAVAFQNLSGGPLTYTPTALAGEENYPEIQLVDSAGEIYPVNRRNPQRYSIAGSSLQYIPHGLPAHWTLGWQVPVAQAEDMVLQALWNDEIVAEWDLESFPESEYVGWEPPTDMKTLETGDSFNWSVDDENDTVLSIEIGRSFAQSCGHPDLVVSAGVGSIVFDITNEDTREAYFPEVAYPDIPMYAIWADGSSARYGDNYPYFAFGNTDVDFNEDFDPFSPWYLYPWEQVVPEHYADFFQQNGFNDEILERSSSEFIVYPEETERRFVSFPVPRFRPLVDNTAAPVALLLAPPTGETIWVDLDIAEVKSVPTSYLWEGLDLDDDDIIDIRQLEFYGYWTKFFNELFGGSFYYTIDDGDVFVPTCDAAVPSIALDLGFEGSYHLLVVPETDNTLEG